MSALAFDPDMMTPRGAPPSKPPSMFWLGLGFAADSYDLFVVNLALQYMTRDGKAHHDLTSAQHSWIASIAIVGAMIGQVLFGGLSERIGRVRVGLLTLSLMALGALGSSVLTLIAGGFFVHMVIWRFVLGVGIGGEYPLSSVLCWEFSLNNQLRNVAAVFSMQGIGAMASPLLILIITQFTDNRETVWRLAFGFGLVPCIMLLWPRFRMKETREFRILQRRRRGEATIEEEEEGAANDERNALDDQVDIEKESLIGQSQSRRPSVVPGAVPAVVPGAYSTRRMLVGTCLVWFLFDIAFYANSMFNASILSTLGLGDSLPQMTLMTLYLTLIALPGYGLGVLAIQYLPLFWIQAGGLGVLSCLYLLLAVVDLSKLNNVLLLFIYGLTFLVSNAGPNLSTYVLPVSIFPTEHRMSYHGLSAACGKLGALVGTALLKPILERYGVGVVLAVCAMCSALAVLVTCICIPMRAGIKKSALSKMTEASSSMVGAEEADANKQI